MTNPQSILVFNPEDLVRTKKPEEQAAKATSLRALADLASWRADDRDAWLKVGMALHTVSDDLLHEWDRWSRTSSKWKRGECERLWRGFRRGGGVGLPSLIHWAKHDRSHITEGSVARATTGIRCAAPRCCNGLSDRLPSAVLSSLLRDYRDGLSRPRLRQLSRLLGVSLPSLRRLKTGWDGDAWTFPMRDEGGRVIGVRRRLADGGKLSVKGGREGLFVPKSLCGRGSLLMPEGPTDTGALLDLGFDAVGRPSARGRFDLATGYVRRHRRERVVVVADNDVTGRLSADDLAFRLCLVCRDVRVMAPPARFKDTREWVRNGATRDELIEAVCKADRIRAKVR